MPNVGGRSTTAVLMIYLTANTPREKVSGQVRSAGSWPQFLPKSKQTYFLTDPLRCMYEKEVCLSVPERYESPSR